MKKSHPHIHQRPSFVYHLGHPGAFNWLSQKSSASAYVVIMQSRELQPTSSRRDEVGGPGTKADIDLIESGGHGRAATYEESVAAHLPKAHRDYLLERHGTLELDPIPGMGPADPYNWPEWKVSS